MLYHAAPPKMLYFLAVTMITSKRAAALLSVPVAFKLHFRDVTSIHGHSLDQVRGTFPPDEGVSTIKDIFGIGLV